MFQLPTENNKHRNFEWGRGGGYMGGVWILLFSEGTIFEYKVSIILSPIVAPSWYKNAAKPAWEQAMSKTESSMQRKSFPIAWG